MLYTPTFAHFTKNVSKGKALSSEKVSFLASGLTHSPTAARLLLYRIGVAIIKFQGFKAISILDITLRKFNVCPT